MTEVLSELPTPRELLNKLGGTAALEPVALAEVAHYEGQPLAVACSGGPDSVAAAMITRALHGGPLTLLHFNHHLRADAADGDEAFVQKLATKLGADFRVGHWAPPANATETTAREARFEFLHGWEYPPIIFGHHADDAAETLLMRLARGAALEGLCAPHPVNRVGTHLHIRPLLNLRKAQIVAALEALGIPYRIDATNAGDDFLRNRIRNELLPLWQSFEPRDVVAGILASREELCTLYKKAPPATPSEPLTLTPWATPYAASTLPIGATLLLPNGMSLSARLVAAPTLAELKSQSDPATHVWVRTTSALVVRAWARGERYTPMGAPGSRKIKELLNAAPTAAALAPEVRATWPVVVDANRDEALWVPCCRPADTAAITAGEAQALELRFGLK